MYVGRLTGTHSFLPSFLSLSTYIISREEGPKMLMKGLGATLVGYSIQGSLKYGLYAIFKAVVKNALPGSSIFVNYIMASIMADVIASTALCPLEVGR